MTATTVAPKEARELIAKGAIPVDIRGPAEFAQEHLPKAQSLPVTDIQTKGLKGNFQKGDTVVAYCQIGRRSTMYAGDIEKAVAPAKVYLLDGGLNNWKQAGESVDFDAEAPQVPISLMRQVQITAGSLVVAGVVLSKFVHPDFVYLSAFIGSGLVFAGASGTCAMAMALAQLPWNKNAPFA